MTIWFRLGLSACLPLLAVAAALPASAAGPPNPYLQWPMFGQNYANTALAPTEAAISVHNVSTLMAKWVLTTNGDISARAAVVGGYAYVPDWAGYFYKVNASTGAVVWQKRLSTDYGLASGTVSRTSPAVQGSTVYIGTQTGAYILAINTTDGSLQWKTRLDGHQLAIDTASPVVYNGVLYVGVASTEEGAAVNPSYPCCTFRGSAVALNATTGTILWKTYTVPSGYTGGSVWGSTPVVDPTRHSVYVTTGNNYSHPTDPAYVNCINAGGTQQSCLSPSDWFDSVLSLDMTTGAIKWGYRLGSADDWNVACIAFLFPGGSTANCPTGSGPDYDFGSGVNLFAIQTPSGTRTLLGAGQKSGIYVTLDPDTGHPVWATQVGPGSSLGGIEWGSSTDGNRIYVAIVNDYGQPYQAPSPLAGTGASSGSFAALDPTTGKILWQTPDPNNTIALGPTAIANGVMYASDMAGSATASNQFALDAATGKILWSHAAGGSVNAGADIAGGMVFWGSGYSNLGLGTASHRFYAFSLGGN